MRWYIVYQLNLVSRWKLILERISVFPHQDDTPYQEDDSSQSDVSVTTLCQLYHDTEEESKLSAEASLTDVSEMQTEHGEWLQLQQQYEERIAADQAVINRYKQALTFFLTSQTPNEEGMNKIMQLENMYEKKISVLKLRIKELKNQNTNLQKNLENLQRSREQEKCDNCDWNSLFEEISNLKTKLADVQSSKDTLEENHREVLFHYQREMANALCHLCQRLNEAKLRNRNVEMKLQVALDQLENLFVQPSKEKLAHTTEDCECTENKNQVHDVNSKLMSLKSLIALKNEEVKNLEAVLKTHCFKMQEEVNFIKDDLKVVSEKKDKKFKAKVTELQKVVDKHCRMKAKLLKNYNNKLCYMQKERHLEVKGLELQLHTQRAEIVASLSRDKQKELEVMVANLEERYKEMLLETEKKFMRRQEEDQKRISQLEAELSDHLPKKHMSESQ
ncbi:hypothetical protein R5R35_006761 [Gryllus longicercus]|uniref:Uncharacterized protein n=1 Tax=Gryllus longicercus TaxID=2509291 RepID=A0AAN9YXA2_9ORTH